MHLNPYSRGAGTYTRREEVLGVFSHEPNAVRDPDTGEWVLFYTAHIPAGASPAPHSPPCNCTDGSTVGRCGGTGVEGATYVSWAKSPDGPWTKPLYLFAADATYLDKEGRFHALFHNMQPGGNRPATNLGHAYRSAGHFE